MYQMERGVLSSIDRDGFFGRLKHYVVCCMNKNVGTIFGIASCVTCCTVLHWQYVE